MNPSLKRGAPARGSSSFGLSSAPARSAAPDHFLFAAADDAPLRAPRDSGAIWLSCCDSAALSPRAHAAAERAYTRLMSGAGRPLPHWFDELRRRLLDLFGVPGAVAVLAGSVSEAEAVFANLTRAALSLPVRRIAAAAPERPDDPAGDLATLPLRDRYGLPRESAEIDAETVRLAEEAMAQNCAVALQLCDCSESGLAGPSRTAARVLAESHPAQVAVLIDARQWIAPQQIAEDLRAGFAVLLSGSRFAGGPAGAAALLLPPAFADRLGAFDLSASLVANDAAMNWPRGLRDRLRGEFAAMADLALGLRWECALAELEACFAVAPAVRAEIDAAFAQEIRRHLAAAPALRLVDCGWAPDEARRVFSILTFDERGRPLKTEALRRALAEPSARRSGRAARGRPVYLGAPLRIGAFHALRLSFGAAHVNDVAERIGEGRSFAAAFQPLADDLLEAFGLWSEIAASDCL